MNIYINSDNQLIDHPKFNNPVTSLTFKRGDVENLKVYFVEDNVVVTPLSGRDLIFGCKPSGAYDSTSFIVYAASATIVSDYYLLKPSFNTSEINNLLLVDGISTNDLTSITLMVDFIGI